MKKFLSLVLALVMTMSLVTVSAGAKDFTDNDAITYEEAVAVMSEIGVIDGYTTGDFKPTATLTRGAAAKIICNLILGPTTAGALAATTAPFSDVAADSTFAGYIAYLSKEGIIGGYADGTFKPGNSLTGYAFLKMLLGALGYDAAIEGYNGANYAVTVAKQAIEAGLTAGLVKEFDGRPAVTREEACLYAFNTLQAIMVEYDNRIVVGEGATAVAISGVRKDLSWNKGTKNDGNIDADGYVQFAEQYFPKLVKEDTTDDFGRPANKWVYKNAEVGTYVDYTLMVAEYTTAVSGKEVYEAIGKTAMTKYDLYSAADGNADKGIMETVAKDNKDDVKNTGNGVLTQVFVDADSQEVIVTEINTYLAIADADYSAKKDEATFDVYGLEKTGKVYAKAADQERFTVSGEDFDVSDVKEDDAYLFTVAAGSVQSFVPAEVVADTEITSFKVGSNVTVDGTKYSFNKAAYYKNDVLKAYTDGEALINLKDTTYNVYLDTYGYLIGLDKVDEVLNYVFITGADAGSSNLATKTTEANAIFLDGTSKVIDVSTTKGNGDTVTGPVVNAWFTYTVDKNDVYTLKTIKSSDFDSKTDKVGQKAQTVAKSGALKIDKKNISLEGAGDFSVVYGKSDSIYLTAELKKVKNNGEYAVISGVENVTTGVKNASIEVWTEAEAAKDANVTVNSNANKSNVSSGVYTLFKNNGYVIAAVVVGDDAAATKNLVYVNSDKVEMEAYDKTQEEWTWTRKAISAEGKEIELTEKSDALTYIGTAMTAGKWYQVKYDANGNVVDATLAETALDAAKGEWIKTFYDIKSAIADNDTVLFEAGAIAAKLTLKGSTLYHGTELTRGVAIDDDTNVVFIQKNDNKKTTSIETGVKALEAALKNLNETSAGACSYEFSAIIEDGVATTVVIWDQVEDGYTKTEASKNGDITLVSFNESTRKATMKYDNSVVTDAEAVKDFIKVVLTEKGYTWTDVTGAYGEYTASVLVQGNASAVEFTFTKV